MKAVVTDYTFETLDVEDAVLAPAGHTLVGRRCKTREELVELVSDADVVITQFAPVDAAVIGAMTRARAIVRYGVGVDNVDLDAARARGIPVCNVPDYCVEEVADHTLAMMLALTRGILPNHDRVRGGGWGLAVPVGGMRALRDLTVGVVGFGRIGRAVVARLRAFGATVLVHDPVVSAQDVSAAGAMASGFDDLLAGSDVVTLHCPSNARTRRMVNRDTLAAMRPGALLVNVGRGDLVDSAALVEALQSGKLAGAALDVFDPEPIPADHLVRRMPNVVLASHVASVSPRAVRALREGAATTALKALRGEPLPNVVNGVVPSPPIGREG
jgi:D-3-phosphoglycerate dehydrogenase